jgi:AraC family transcriptional regulator, transcriptional activator of pobA
MRGYSSLKFNADAMKKIPIRRLQDRVNTGIEVRHSAQEGAREFLETLQVHRDDSFSFLVIEKGGATMDVDFVNISLPGNHIYYLVAGQIHHNIVTNGGDAWFISINPTLIPKNFKQVFEGNLLLQLPVKLEPLLFKQFQNVILMLDEQLRNTDNSPFSNQLIHSLLDSFLCMFAREFVPKDHNDKKPSRLVQITQQFKKLMTEKIRIEKSPSFYAGQLNISETYLNEAVKDVTGFSVTHWLMNEIMLEAKRLLIYSQYNVREIADQLGYEDHNYFSRLFKKQSNVTPSGFRAIYVK